MEYKSKKIDFSFFKIFELLQYTYPVFLLNFGILLFDSLETVVYKYGIMDTDFSIFFNLSKIPFLLFFMLTFGITATHLSHYLFVVVHWLYVWIYDKPERNKNIINFSYLYEIALITENNFLLEYIKKEKKAKDNMQKNYHIIYSLVIAILFNIVMTLITNTNTIFKYILSLYTDNGSLSVKIFTTVLLAPIIITILYSIKLSLEDDENSIYFPDAKYELLLKEKNSLLNKK